MHRPVTIRHIAVCVVFVRAKCRRCPEHDPRRNNIWEITSGKIHPTPTHGT